MKSVKAQVGRQVRVQVWDQVRDQVGRQVRDQVRDQVGRQVDRQVWAQVGVQVLDEVWEQLNNTAFSIESVIAPTASPAPFANRSGFRSMIRCVMKTAILVYRNLFSSGLSNSRRSRGV